MNQRDFFNSYPEYSKEKSIFISGEVRSSKNSKQIWKKPYRLPKTLLKKLGGRITLATYKNIISSGKWYYDGKRVIPFITDSNLVKAYKLETGLQYNRNAKIFQELIKDKKLPLYIEFLFFREFDKSWDFNNLTQIVQDMMVKHKWMCDDDVYNMLPVPPKPAFIVDQDFQGVLITVL